MKRNFLSTLITAAALAIVMLSGCSKTVTENQSGVSVVYAESKPSEENSTAKVEVRDTANVKKDAASIELNNNLPNFSKKEIRSESFESYSELDSLGRCGVAFACIGKDIMPTESRGNIGMIKPSGWNQNKYPGIVNSNPPYLYNRCHLIGYQLSGENANERNLITGTRYLNVEGMLPYENKVADYVETTGNHVLYRVTPDFTGSNLLCNGVQIEAYSVEDSGRGISFNVYCFNIQPGVDIDYSDGSNRLSSSNADNVSKPASASESASEPESKPTIETPADITKSYVANKNSKKFHYPSCKSVDDMKESNKWYYEGSRDELIDQGYEPCKRCNP